jgi:hypothetical protein
VSGRPPRKLTQFTSQLIEGFDVRRDGTLICARNETTSDIVLIRSFR